MYRPLSRIGCMLFCAALFLSACAAPAAPAIESVPVREVSVADISKADALAPASTATKVWPDPAIDGNLSQAPSAGADFSAYINHDWYANTAIPDGYERWTVFSQLAQDVQTQMIALLKAPGESVNEQKAAALFASAMNSDTRDAAGNSTIMRSFRSVGDVQSLAGLNDLLAGDAALYHFTPLIVSDVSADLHNSAVNVAYLYAPSLSLEDSAEYDQMSEQGKRFKAANDTFYKALLTHNGVPETEADAMIADAFAFERLLAAGNYPLATSYRDDYYTLAYNEFSPEALFALTPNFPLQAILENAGLGEAKRFIVVEPEAIKNLNAVYTEENLPGIRAYLQIGLLESLAPYGDTFSQDAHAAWDNEKYGATGTKPAEERAYDICCELLDELLGLVYAARYFDEAAKADVTAMTGEIVNTFKQRINAADWLTAGTRKTAIEKLDALTLRIGYPTNLVYTWDEIQIAADAPLIENAMNLSILLAAQKYAKADQPTDQNIWGMSANTVNAYYDASDNSINFPAAILQAPFYASNASRSANLGGIGAVIAHEITHAFDTGGSQFDEYGNMVNWWTDEDRAAFRARTDIVAARYEAIDVLNGAHVQGDLTIGETVADLGALACTLDIMAGLKDANYDEYFRAYTGSWAERITPEARLYRLKNDPHPPCYLRANITVSQYQAFYDTYDIQPSDFMYTAPADRLVVW